LNAQLNPAPDSGHKKLVDVWRHLHPDAVGYYTYFSARFQCRQKGIGWRLDSFIVSRRAHAPIVSRLADGFARAPSFRNACCRRSSNARSGSRSVRFSAFPPI
jgi:hypothetical protein